MGSLKHPVVGTVLLAYETPCFNGSHQKMGQKVYGANIYVNFYAQDLLIATNGPTGRNQWPPGIGLVNVQIFWFTFCLCTAKGKNNETTRSLYSRLD